MSYIERIIDDMAGKTVVFWGAGRRVRRFMETLCFANRLLPVPDFICDSTRVVNEESLYGIPVLQIDDLKKMDYDKTVIIMTAGLFDLQAQVIKNELYYFPIYHCRSFEVYWYLKNNRAQMHRVMERLADDKSRAIYGKLFDCYLDGTFWCQSLFEGNAYFGNDVIGDLGDGDTFVYAGAFNGKHIDRALRNNGNVAISAFEPNRGWYDFLLAKYADRPNVALKKLVLWDRAETLSFDGDSFNSGLDAHVVGCDDVPGGETVCGEALDNVIDGKVTLIALDVEGSEARALSGAASLIRDCHPKLAICLYHNVEDFIDIPLLIDRLAGESYRFHVKQHSCVSAIETVLYAV